MATYYTDTPEYGQQNVYHDREDCPDGKQIKREHRRAGKGVNRRRCKECAKLDG